VNGTRVLVAGAAGLIGRAVTDNLLACGIAVTALVLHDPGDLAADRVVVGDASDPDVVRTGLADVEAVVHLAALPSPNHGTALEVFGGNTRATFVVLEEAGNAGVRRAVIASSYSILGLPWSPRTLHPAYLPIDEQLPLQIEDPYGLSKLVDEKTAEMMSCRHGMDIMALRFPFVSNEQRQRHRLEATIADPAVGAAEVWSYLDVRDAAEACRLAITVPVPGYHTVFLAAPQTLAPFLTEELIAAYHPQSQLRRRIPRRDVPIDLSAAEDLLGFRARHLVDLDVRPLPDARPYA
jgi:nucleoside-diphosphate-sugar epimerase